MLRHAALMYAVKPNVNALLDVARWDARVARYGKVTVRKCRLMRNRQTWTEALEQIHSLFRTLSLKYPEPWLWHWQTWAIAIIRPCSEVLVKNCEEMTLYLTMIHCFHSKSDTIGYYSTSSCIIRHSRHSVHSVHSVHSILSVHFTHFTHPFIRSFIRSLARSFLHSSIYSISVAMRLLLSCISLLRFLSSPPCLPSYHFHESIHCSNIFCVEGFEPATRVCGEEGTESQTVASIRCQLRPSN